MCEAENVALRFSLAEGNAGGEPLDDVMGQREELETYTLKPCVLFSLFSLFSLFKLARSLAPARAVARDPRASPRLELVTPHPACACFFARARGRPLARRPLPSRDATSLQLSPSLPPVLDSCYLSLLS